MNGRNHMDGPMKPFRYLQRSWMQTLGAAALLGLAACATAPIHDATYVLKPQQTLDLARGLTLTYDSFSDSRCPANVRCVWPSASSCKAVTAAKNSPWVPTCRWRRRPPCMARTSPSI
jgi:hypothetical protein